MSRRTHSTTDERQSQLLEIPPQPAPVVRIPPLRNPVWTENKAHLIQRYLFYFIQITKNCTYIDGFAGPQEKNRPDLWSANLVLGMEPFWIGRFYLCDVRSGAARELQELKNRQPLIDARGRKVNRTISVIHGDFNAKINDLLTPANVPLAKATFCLLDQRTMECHWATLRKLAAYKSGCQHKVELFYFLAVGWLHRSFSGLTRNSQKATLWWGNEGWRELRRASQDQIRDLVVSRLETELGYAHVKPWPIYQKAESDMIMYYMVHASDHDEAPRLMARAYAKSVRAVSKNEQMQLAGL